VFISANSLPEQTIFWQTVIHVVFLVSALAIALIDRVMTIGGRPGQGSTAAH